MTVTAAAGRRTASAGLALLRAVLLVVAALTMVLTGGVEPAPRSTTPTVAIAVGSVSRAPGPASRTDSGTPVSVLRAGLAATSAPTPAGGALAPGAGPLVAPHLVSVALGRPPTSPLLPVPHGAPDGRAPPVTTGT